jgi:AraC family ethanolamine operon transcriptional activator
MLAAFERQAFKRDLAALRGDEPTEHASPALMDVPSSTLTLIRRTALDLLSAAGSGLARAAALERRELDLRGALLDLASPLDTGRGAGLPSRDIVAWANEVCVRKGSFRISVADLCRGVGVSRSTLYRAFWEVCGTAPSTYLSFRRMTEARRMLLGGKPQRGAVKRAAIDSGHMELGRFSVEYRRIFGESPTATLNWESSD